LDRIKIKLLSYDLFNLPQSGEMEMTGYSDAIQHASIVILSERNDSINKFSAWF